jgi:hypothetical protein
MPDPKRSPYVATCLRIAGIVFVIGGFVTIAETYPIALGVVSGVLTMFASTIFFAGAHAIDRLP